MGGYVMYFFDVATFQLLKRVTYQGRVTTLELYLMFVKLCDINVTAMYRIVNLTYI